jgi:copper chaperone CopZ
MFNFLKSKTRNVASNTESIILRLTGLHCSSCAVNIDLALEDLPGVKAKTNYAKSETKIQYDPSQVSLLQIHNLIEKLGYKANSPEN